MTNEEQFNEIQKLIKAKDAPAAIEAVEKSFLAKRQYVELLKLALRKGCNPELEVSLRGKAGPYGYVIQGKPGKRKRSHTSKPNETASQQSMKKVYAFDTITMEYCLFDHTKLQRTNIVLSPDIKVIGYTCKKCGKNYVSVKTLNVLTRENRLPDLIIREVSSFTKKKKKKGNASVQQKASTPKTINDSQPVAAKVPVKKEPMGNVPPKVKAPTAAKKRSVVTPKPSAKEVAKTITARRDHRHWWAKDLQAGRVGQRDSLVEMKGSGVLELAITIGIDFGANTTKISTLVAHGPQSSFLDPIALSSSIICERGSDDLLVSSQIQRSSDGRIAMSDTGNGIGACRQYFKSILVDENTIASDPDEIYYAIFFIANILKASIKVIQDKYSPTIYKNAKVSVMLGMPVSTTVGVLPNLFKNILATAAEYKDQPNIDSREGIPFEQWKQQCRSRGSEIGELKRYLNVQPEVYAEVLNLFMSTAGPGSRALVVDIGSSTVDIAYMVSKRPLFPYLYIPIAEVLPFGVEVVSAALLKQFPKRYSSLQASREALRRGVVPIPFTNEILSSMKGVMRSIFTKIRKLDEFWPVTTPDDRHIPIYFFGGGRQIPWYTHLFKEVTKANTFKLDFVMPQWTFERIPRVPGHLLHRYQVAIGLAEKDSESLPLKALPNAFDSFWNMPEKKKNISLLDLEELQANLYGR